MLAGPPGIRRLKSGAEKSCALRECNADYTNPGRPRQHPGPAPSETRDTTLL